MISSEKNKIYIIIFFSIAISSIYYFSFVPNLNEKKIYKFTIIIKPINIFAISTEGYIQKKPALSHSEFISLFLNKIDKDETKKICKIKNIKSKKFMFFDYYLHIEKSLNEHLEINFNAEDICFNKIKLTIYETQKELLNDFNSSLNIDLLPQGTYLGVLKFYKLQINDKIKILESYTEFKKKEINKTYKIFLTSLLIMIISFLLMSLIFFNKYIFYFFQRIKKKNFNKSVNKKKFRIGF
jgi:hypothetical protein